MKIISIWAFLLFAILPLHAEWAKPEGFFEEEVIRRQQVAPGVEWISASGKREGKPLHTHVLAIDLKTPGVSLKPLFSSRPPRGQQFFPRAPVSGLQEEAGAVAAINNSFFHISDTQTPTGLTVRDGVLVREPAPTYPAIFFDSKRGVALVEGVEWEGHVRLGEQEQLPLAAVNPFSVTGEAVALFRHPWQRAPGAGAKFLKEGGPVVEVIVKQTGTQPLVHGARWSGVVSEVRLDQPARPLEEGEFLLLTRTHPALTKAKPGEAVEVEWKLTGVPGEESWPDALAGTPMLVRGGEPIEGEGQFWRVRHPRSAIGVSPDRTGVLLVLVDGRSKVSAGVSLSTLRDYFIHLGAHDALNLDGGGSSAMTIRDDGAFKVLNRPSDGRERWVPTGIGVFADGETTATAAP